MEKKPIELPPNTVIGAWKPNNLIGQGGQGAVWAAKPLKVKHTPQRALKACFARDEQGMARFVREVETLQRCDSPNILKVYDQDLEWREHVPGLPPFAYYVSEKCQGSMEQRQPHLGDPRRRLDLFKQACAAVTYLHSMQDPVLHRDIKPANFLIANELSNVVLADFGIARAFSDNTLTQAFEIVGTPFYRAPEVLHGSRGTVESDVYSLGRLLEWLLTGEISTDMATRPVPRGLELDDDACNVLDGIIAKATQVTPAHRYNSVQALADQVPELWISVRPRPKPGPVLPDTTPATVLPAALHLAQTNDLLGWRQLQNQLRRDFVDRIVSWRKEWEWKWPGDRNKEGGIAYTDSLLALSMGRLVFGLAGVYSNNVALADQRQVVEDLLSVPDWSRAGTTAIFEAPRTLVYVFQYLHGALCMSYGQPDLALQLARMSVPDRDRADTWALWRDHGLVGWPELLGGSCDWAWEYVVKLRDRHPVLEQFFALKSDYEGALATYSMLMVLYNVADDASSATPEALANPDNLGLDFPPLFVGQSSEVITGAARRTLRNKQLVERVAALAGTNVDAMQKLWPARRKAIFRWGREVFHRHYFDTDRDNPIPRDIGLTSS
jgi:hypothetical protein